MGVAWHLPADEGPKEMMSFKKRFLAYPKKVRPSAAPDPWEICNETSQIGHGHFNSTVALLDDCLRVMFDASCFSTEQCSASPNELCRVASFLTFLSRTAASSLHNGKLSAACVPLATAQTNRFYAGCSTRHIGLALRRK